MTPYLALLSARFRMLLQYRAAALAGMGTQLFWGLVRVMVFEAFYRSATGPHPMSLEEVRDYVWLGQALFALLPFAIDGEIRQMIRTGSVAYELARPLDLYALWYCRAVASRTAPTLLRSVPLFTGALLFFGLRPPPSGEAAAAWVLCTAAAVLLACALSTLMHICLLWTIAGEGVAQLAQAGVFVLSGMIVPLPLFPDWARPVLDFLPFRGLADLPFRVWAGHIPPAQVWGVLAHQVAWTAALVLAGRALLGRGTRRLVVQGG
ncbi:MAG: ABC-2 family transporter protein [Candidatus Latescibacterota bacterium]